MKNQIKVIIIVFIAFSQLLQCRKDIEKVPGLITKVSEIRATTASFKAIITDYGNLKVIDKGICYSTESNPTISKSRAQIYNEYGNTFDGVLTGLRPVTNYYARAFATNSAGTGYGNEISFSTRGDIPGVHTYPATNLGLRSATLNGAVNGNWLNTSVIIEYGLSTSYGSEITQIHTEGYSDSLRFVFDSTGITTYVSGLSEGTTYHYRIKAVNSLGTAYGNDMSFSTLNIPVGDIVLNSAMLYGSVSDIDGNKYRTIQIGRQTWMAENLRTTKFNDGTPLVHMPLEDNGYNGNPGYSFYNNDPATYKTVYGALYNWRTIYYQTNNSRNICPEGWHVPDDNEWDTLTTYLGGLTVAGGKLKETGTSHWISPNTRGTNLSGFTAVPGGFGSFNGTSYTRLGEMGYWWSSARFEDYAGWARVIYKNNSDIMRVYVQASEMSVRCVKD